jgi:hypothetical protein
VKEQPGANIARRDEMLEFLYWIEGEGLGGAATLDAAARFLSQPVEEVHATLVDLVSRGEAAHDSRSGEYRLTDEGRREGARRFAEEFAPMLKQGHGECDDPECDCHADPTHAAECHSRPGRRQ